MCNFAQLSKFLGVMTHRHNLILISGILWSMAGIMLIVIFLRWIHLLTNKQLLWALVIGIPIGILKGWLFNKLSKKNIYRINLLPVKVEWWKFQKLSSYILILLMMATGITLRTSGIIAKKYLAPVYLGIGLALFISSIVYYTTYFKHKKLRLATELD